MFFARKLLIFQKGLYITDLVCKLYTNIIHLFGQRKGKKLDRKSRLIKKVIFLLTIYLRKLCSDESIQLWYTI